jgi:hypothetical protein
MWRRIFNLLIALDQLAYVVITLGHGSPDETISSAAWRLEQDGRIIGKLARPFIDALFWVAERDHCRKAYESERTRSHLPDQLK